METASGWWHLSRQPPEPRLKLDKQTVQIVDVFPEDLIPLQEISRNTFSQAFASVNTPENIEFFLEHHYSTDKIASEIRNPDSRFFFVKLGDGVIGYLKINRLGAQTVLPNDHGVEIERIYVDENFKGGGIGKLLIEKALTVAKEYNAKYVWLGVWEKNSSAIRFYKKNGFIQYGNHIFRLGNDDQTDLLFKKNLAD
jgi:diamine N-acetyltransferase